MSDKNIGREGKLRIQLDLPKTSAERLHRYKDYIEASTYSETVRELLKVAEELISLREYGYEIVARAEDGKTFPVFIMAKP